MTRVGSQRHSKKKKARQYKYERNIEARLCNHCCSGKAISFTYSDCVRSLRCTPCNAHAPYCHLWPARLYHIFPHYLINGTILTLKSLN